MINAIDALLRKWKGRESNLLQAREIESIGDSGRETRLVEIETLSLCIRELRDTVVGVKPAPITEASTEKLYKWAGRMVQIMDLMIAARDTGDEIAMSIGHDLGDLATQDFLNDIYDLFKQLANRQSGA